MGYLDDLARSERAAKRLKDRAVEEFVIPVTPTDRITLRVTTPMTPGEWDRMLAMLAAMKPGLVVPYSQQPRAEPPEDDADDDENA